MDIIECFPPVADKRASVLILGSMPGGASLAAAEYYAHPRNHFWPVMGDLFGAAPALPYSRRLEILKENHIALWDVLSQCLRPGSLDSAITEPRANDFRNFFKRHSQIRNVYFNGAPAAKFFRKFVTADNYTDDILFTTLPSTSPANASWSYARKLAAWRCIPDQGAGAGAAVTEHLSESVT